MKLLIHTIVSQDIGKAWIKSKSGRVISVSEFMGRVMEIDIGKRIYDLGTHIGVESQDQLERRLNNS